MDGWMVGLKGLFSYVRPQWLKSRNPPKKTLNDTIKTTHILETDAADLTGEGPSSQVLFGVASLAPALQVQFDIVILVFIPSVVFIAQLLLALHQLSVVELHVPSQRRLSAARQGRWNALSRPFKATHFWHPGSPWLLSLKDGVAKVTKTHKR